MGTVKFTLDVGAAIRAHVKSNIKQYCFTQNIVLEIDEDKGWLSSVYYFTLTGKSNILKQAIVDINRYMKQYEMHDKKE